jgi:hypothetical protein
MTRFERERLAVNLAEVIDDKYRVLQPRDRRIRLVARYVERAIFAGWKCRGALIDSEEDQP